MSVAVRYYLKIKAIKGDSKDANYQGAIDILNWSWGGGRRPGGGAGGIGGESEPPAGDMVLNMEPCTASVALLRHHYTGLPIGDPVVLDTVQHKHLLRRQTMTECMISSYSTNRAPNRATPIHTFSLNFAKISTVQYPKP